MLNDSGRKNLMHSFDQISTTGKEPSDASTKKLLTRWGFLHVKYSKKKAKIRVLTNQLRKKTATMRALIREALEHIEFEVSDESEDQDFKDSEMQE